MAAKEASWTGRSVGVPWTRKLSAVTAQAIWVGIDRVGGSSTPVTLLRSATDGSTLSCTTDEADAVAGRGCALRHARCERK